MDGIVMNKKEQAIMTEAKTRFKHCEAWESDAREKIRYDIRFNAGDDKNGFQWDINMFNARVNGGRPCLTINKTRQCTLAITNYMKQNPIAMEVKPVGNASFKSAQAFEGIIRHIESLSQAQSAYDTAFEGMVIAGYGVWRIITDYIDDNSFDQEIKIQRIADPLSVYIDPDCIEQDKSDMRFAFIFNDMPRDRFEKEYPDFKNVSDSTGLDEESHAWWNEEHVRIAEYYRRTEVPDRLHHLLSGESVKESEAKATGTWDELQKYVSDSRDILSHKVEWYKLAGNQIIDTGMWHGKWIPIIPCIGEETIIEGKMDRKGHVRNLIPTQQEYNILVSNNLEFLLLQTKIPWLVSAESIKGYTAYWDANNVENYAVLPYNAIGPNSVKLDPPQRNQPPQSSPGFMDGVKLAQMEFDMVSGQYGPTFGEPNTPERSGKALDSRIQQGNNQTAHFANHMSKAIINCTRQIIELIPHIYDTKRTIKILDTDSTMKTIQIDPNNPDAHEDVDGLDDESWNPDQVAMILNPNVGYYEVIAATGPSYQTRREKAFEAIGDILAQNETLAPNVIDLWFAMGDFPLSNEMSQRMKRLVPPAALGRGPTVGEQKANQALVMQHQIVIELQEKVKHLSDKTAIEQQQKEIDMFRAQTERMKVAAEIDPEMMKVYVRAMGDQGITQSMDDVIHQHNLADAVSKSIINTINPVDDTGQAQGAQPNG